MNVIIDKNYVFDKQLVLNDNLIDEYLKCNMFNLFDLKSLHHLTEFFI